MFYLIYRAWSHWRALSGSRHIQFLLENKFIKPTPSTILDTIYSNGHLPFDAVSKESAKEPSNFKNGVDLEERMVLHESNGKRIAEALDIPELTMELDRAVWQVEKALSGKKELKEEQQDLKAANAEPKEKQ